MDQFQEITSKAEKVLMVMDALTGLPSEGADDSLWREVSSRDFGLEEKFEETWQEEYEFQVKKRGFEILPNAVENNNLKLIDFILEKAEISEFDCNTVLEKAIEEERLSVLSFLIEKMRQKYIEIDYDSAIVSAIKSGKADMVKRVSKIAKNNCKYESSIMLEEAAAKAKLRIFNLFRDEMKEDCPRLLMRAVEGGNLEIVKQVIEKVRIFDLNILEAAARGGNREIINLIMIKCPEFSYETFLIGAIDGCHLELVTETLDYVLKHDLPIDYTNIWEVIGMTGKKEIVDLLLERELNPHPLALYGALTFKRSELVKIIMDLLDGDDLEYDDLLLMAIQHDDIQSANFILDKMWRKGLNPNYKAFLEDSGYDLERDMVKLIMEDIIERDTITDHKEWILEMIYQAAERDYQDILRESLLLIAEKGKIVVDYNQIALRAARGRHVEIMRIAIDKLKKGDIPVKYHRILQEAKDSGSSKLVKDLVDEMN